MSGIAGEGSGVGAVIESSIEATTSPQVPDVVSA